MTKNYENENINVQDLDGVNGGNQNLILRASSKDTTVIEQITKTAASVSCGKNVAVDKAKELKK